VSVADVFRLMHEQSVDAGITDWGVGQVTLEDVFHKIVGGDHGQGDEQDFLAAGSGQVGYGLAQAESKAGPTSTAGGAAQLREVVAS